MIFQSPTQLRSSQRKSGGYVLIVTLGVLVLATTLLVAVGQAAAHHAIQARIEQSELQQRWGTLSCRTAVFSRAEQILVSQEQQEHRAVPEFHATVQLGGDSFTLIIADEQAKANVNSLIDQFGKAGAEDRIRQGLIGSGLLNQIRLRPGSIAGDSETPAAQPAGPPRLIFGPGQIFDSIDAARLINPQSGSQSAMQNLTCWGDGRINVMRANQQSMRLSLTPALTQLEISRLINARDSVLKIPITSHVGQSASVASNTDAIGSLLTQAHIDAGRRNRLALTGRSSCHSLWIITDDGRRTWYSMTISDESDPRRPLSQSIVW